MLNRIIAVNSNCYHGYSIEDAVAGIDAAKDGGFAAAGLGEAAEYGRTDHPLNTFGDLCGIL